MSLHNYK